VIGSLSFHRAVPVGVAAEADRPFEVALDLDRAHLFDKASGQVIAV
jgi:multiple sugar transport system ATP-binding protein